MTTLPCVDGKYLAEARRQMLEAKAQGVSAEEHSLASLAALTEAFTELEARVTSMEVGREKWVEQLGTSKGP